MDATMLKVDEAILESNRLHCKRRKQKVLHSVSTDGWRRRKTAARGSSLQPDCRFIYQGRDRKG